MRISLALAAALSIVAGAASAETVRVRSGEHADFSRLVFYLPEAGEPELDRQDGVVELDFGADYDFNTSDVFYYIPRDRIAEMTSPGPGRVRLELACDCEVVVEPYGTRNLVLDVRDEPATAARFRPGSELLPAIMPEAYTALLPNADAMLIPVAARSEDTPGPVAGPVKAAVDPAVRKTADALIDQIARAASLGLVDANLDALPQPETAEPEPEAEIQAPSEPVRQETAARPRTSDEHVTIISSIDRDLGEIPALERNTDSCLPAEQFDVGAWLPGEQAGGIAALRTRVIGEFDSPTENGIRDLARAYIAVTFGAEASAVLSAFGGHPDADILHAMADVVDFGHTERGGRLASQIGCPTGGALWAAFATEVLPEPEAMDTSAIILAFADLPAALRKRLGPLLADRFLDAGMTDTALSIRNAVARAPGHGGHAEQLLEVKLDLETGREEDAQQRLRELVEETDGLSPDSLKLLIERRLESGEAVENHLVEKAAALAYEGKGTPLAAEFTTLEIRSRVSRGEIIQALDRLATAAAAGTLDESQSGSLRGSIYVAAAERLDDAAFLILAVRAEQSLGTSPEELMARGVVAARLKDLGLEKSAARLANPAPAESAAVHPEDPVAAAHPEPQADAAEGATGNDPASAQETEIADADQPADADPVDGAPSEAPAPEVAEPTPEIAGPSLARARDLLQRSASLRERFQIGTGEPAETTQ